jgi:hypothetical protein
MYDISPIRLKNIGSEGFFDILNENSPMKVQKPFEHRVYGKQMTIEEAVIEALKTNDFRIILASLGLFRKINNWNLLYRLAKASELERHVGAMYSLSRKYFRVRRIDGRILRRMKESKLHNKYIIANRKSNDFKEIEQEWGVYIPFNKSDMKRLGV